MVGLSVVIPVYNGASGLDGLFTSLVPVLEEWGRSWEIFLVDDHSGDGSFEKVREYHMKDRRITGCRLQKNRGQQNALYCGLCSCSGEYIITMDDDGQHPVDRIPFLIRTLEEEKREAVYMVNRNPERERILRLGTYATDLFFRLFCGKPRGVEIGSYRILRRALVERIKGQSGKFVYISALIFRSKPRPSVRSLRYEALPLTSGGKSRFSFKRRLIVFVRLFFYYGPFRRFVPRRGFPYAVEAAL